jgi:hypothetical protein
VALGLSLQPLKESISQAVEDTLAPQLFYTVIATGLVTWAVMAANPEPVFTKVAALISALMLLYLGVDTFLPASAVAMVVQGPGSAQPPAELTGQLHHPISKRIADRLDRHATLRGYYTDREVRLGPAGAFLSPTSAAPPGQNRSSSLTGLRRAPPP